MKKMIITFIVMGMMSSFANAQDMTLDQLVDVVKRAATESSQVNKQREATFKRERDQQSRLLSEARAQLAALERRTEELKLAFDENEITLADLETTLAERAGNLGEMAGTVKVLAGDLRSAIEESMTSAEIDDRVEFLTQLASQSKLPNIQELRKLWYEMQREIVEEGKISRFNTSIRDESGEIENGVQVIRVGTFNAFDADGNFLVWKSAADAGTGTGKGELQRLQKQPSAQYAGMAKSFVSSQPGELAQVPVDYTRGTILQLVVQTPSIEEKIKQGGPVGYVILSLGAFGLIIALIKFFMLLGSGGKMKSQLKKKQPNQNNALGRIMSVYTENPDSDIETMELKLDEAILRETGPLESGLSFIKVLYVIAPLLGLLGTVVGMIQTFQMITLMGTGDPKSMAGGISMALVTTVLGLVVAIPLTVLHSVLQSMARKQTQVLEEQSAGIVAKMAEK
ncbi:MotA/TolQ/ExbB proton channel family protein [Marinicella sp. S1101]|uniref:MotA/TolQ/ExbB proton channel family protein n=1 Tax=Marinicella marina TaxID=2996016 RepID=UPI0022608A9A|nr:MotA/TolQ/ExbB proton channel family protein [Marinicella marina]MCX7552622.1 MotA/TolQ/ExbB proton channel family protein [Marinicella marina]MDJ1139498.1 MotA/TolQ/ExbB proton channel family protein [Marinicella marina]